MSTSKFVQSIEMDGRFIFFNSLNYEKLIVRPNSQKTEDILNCLPDKINWALENKIFRIENTFKCNLNCSYCICFRNNIKSKVQEMSLATAKKIAQEANELKIQQIVFTGGEPFLNFKVIEQIQNTTTAEIVILTNGLVISGRNLRNLDPRRTTICVSMDGLTEEENYYRYKKNDMMTKVVKTIGMIKAENLKLGIFLVVHSLNLPTLEKILKKMIVLYEPTFLGVNIPHYTEDGNYILSLEESAQFADCLIRIHKELNGKTCLLQVDKKLSYFNRNVLNFSSCKVSGNQWTFDPSGNKTRCLKLDLVSKEYFNTEDFRPHLPVFRKSCLNCEAIGICGGGCFFDQHKLDPINYLDPRVCCINKKLVRYFIKKRMMNLEKNLSL
ncbi:MAG: radical SAM protein, partial [Bacteroidales bacterium]|nr:radical SAM protein [Bacteroidales bacterium]